MAERDHIADAAQNALDVLGEHTEDIIEEAAEMTWTGKRDWFDSMGTKAAERHSERVFAKVCRALIPLLEHAAKEADKRAREEPTP